MPTEQHYTGCGRETGDYKNTDRPVVQPVVRHYTDWATPAPETY
jgi:hypothetical protein